MKSEIAEIYKEHHTSGDRRGFSIFKDERGAFLRKNIGINKKVLDIGCRDGVLTKTYCEENYVTGVDIDNDALCIAMEDLGIDTKQLDLYSDWELPENHFDAVVAGEVLEHLYYPEKILEKVVKVLNKDGVLLGSVPNAFSLKNRIRFFLGNKKDTPLHDPTHINHFSRNELKSLLEKYFKEVNIYPLGRYTFLDKIWPGMFSFILLFKAKNKK